MFKKHAYKFLFSLVLFLALLLRILRLDALPPSLYWEEAALGYDAYSIFKTAKDHHGKLLPLAALESFGDWKPSLYFYVAVPSIAIFGLSEWGVRMPSVVAGVVIVIGVGQLARLIYSQLKNKSPGVNKRLVQLLAMLVAAVSPWAIHFSRAAWESNLATALILWAVILGIRFIQGKSFKNLTGSTLLLILATYAYHATRLTAPILGLGMIFLAFKNQRLSFFKSQKAESKYTKELVILLILSLVLMLPLLFKITSAQLSQRAAETSIFSQIEIIEQSNQLKDQAGNTFLARIFYHRYLMYARQVLQNLLTHFRLDFLFLNGDTNPRHSIQYLGHLYPLEIIALALGVFFFASNFNWIFGLLAFWLVVGILPSSLTKTTPHALRILNTMPVFLTTISFGWVKLLAIAGQAKERLRLKLVWIGLIFSYVIQFTVFWHYYSLVYPQMYSQYWQAGYREMTTTVEALQQQYPDFPVYISRSQGRPAMYYWFYTQTPPQEVQAEESTAKKDQGEFLEFKQIRFGLGLKQVCQKRCIAAMTKQELEQADIKFDQTSQVYVNHKYSWIVGIKL